MIWQGYDSQMTVQAQTTESFKQYKILNFERFLSETNNYLCISWSIEGLTSKTGKTA